MVIPRNKCYLYTHEHLWLIPHYVFIAGQIPRNIPPLWQPYTDGYSLVICYIVVVENGDLIVLPIKMDDFPSCYVSSQRRPQAIGHETFFLFFLGFGVGGRC